jgi:DNA (cytosine-5)-methyltransferase 1
MSLVTATLEEMGFRWAYRVVDARAFGLPQRRERVILIASQEEDPELVLFGDDAEPVFPSSAEDDRPRGFYWTEGNSGLGWAVDSVPTLKAGSTIGIPSPPAIWLPAYDRVVTPTIQDAEAFQGLPRGWTAAAKNDDSSHRSRWRLVGNAVPVPVTEWVGTRLLQPSNRIAGKIHRLRGNDPWPNAAFGNGGHRFSVSVSTWPVSLPWRGLAARYGDDGVRLLERPALSRRATAGFYDRIKRSSLRTDPRFIPSLGRHLKRQTELQKAE